MADRLPRVTTPRQSGNRPATRRVLTQWYGLMAIGGLAFGLVGERRPFGNDFLAHPLVIFFVVVGVALIALRIALARPVPEVIPERSLVIGCLIGAAGFLVGNWLGVHLIDVGR
jgi:hypothetical protein